MREAELKAQEKRESLAKGKLRSLVLRTPEKQFKDLKGWDYKGSYISMLKGLEKPRMHYVDIGNPNAPRTALCLHGQKTWGYAFRKTIPILLRNNYRVIVPDFFGFGKSDKPASEEFYDFEMHRTSIIRLIQHLKLTNVTLVGFDWGGWIGATLPMEMPDIVQNLLLGNMMLHTPDQEVWFGFHLWKSLQNAQLDPVISEALATEDEQLTIEEARAFDAPYPDYRYKAGVRKFHHLIPLEPQHPTADVTERAIAYLKRDWTGKCICVAGLRDNVAGEKSMRNICSIIRDAKPLVKVPEAGALIFDKADVFLPDAIDYLRL